MADHTRHLQLEVDHWDGAHYTLNGRAAALVAFAVMNSSRINAIQNGSITFNWSGPTFKANLNEHFPSLRTGANA